MHAFASASLDVVSELWTAAKQGGPLTLFLVTVLYVVNDERKQERRKNEALTERLYGGLNNATEAIKDFRGLLSTARRGKDE